MYSPRPYERAPLTGADNSRGEAGHDRAYVHVAAAWYRARLPIVAYLTVSALTLLAIIMLRNDAAMVNSAVWVRSSIVTGGSLVLAALAGRAARGSLGAYLRLRIVSAAMLTATVLIVALPGPFPLWLKTEQSVCGLLLLGVAVVVNGKSIRALFAGKSPTYVR